MKKYFICLANSYKYGGRCLAGIEITIDNNKYSVVRNEDGTPKWIRPVSASEHKELSTTETQNINILDIIEVEEMGVCPEFAHSENIHYSSIKRSSKITKSTGAIDNLCNEVRSNIFFNKGKAVPTNVFQNGTYSLLLIKPESPAIYCDSNDKYRGKFTYNNNEYDLPITDPLYIDILKYDDSSVPLCGKQETGDLYFTISLGEELEGWHYKLIAGIVDMRIAWTDGCALK
ncbi:hypothetical protein EZS27_015275 [termite gut metagenome]|uniref:Dual OB-containing domain-containing protein n=1 Tax=termite gut metagenome TaxID=433724 RepID=A0A5J4RUC8_9ZZZZ